MCITTDERDVHDRKRISASTPTYIYIHFTAQSRDDINTISVKERTNATVQ